MPAESENVHVWYTGDDVKHDLKGIACWCCPELDPVEGQDGLTRFVVVHRRIQ